MIVQCLQFFELLSKAPVNFQVGFPIVPYISFNEVLLLSITIFEVDVLFDRICFELRLNIVTSLVDCGKFDPL